MTLNASSLISLIALTSYGVLFSIVISRNFVNKISRFLGLYLVTMIVWSFGSFMIFADFSGTNILFWNRFMVIGSTGMPIAFFSFLQVYLKRGSHPWHWFGLLIYSITQVANLFGWVIVDAHVINGQLYNEYGAAISLISLCWIFFVGFSTISLLMEYRRSKISKYRNRIKYLLIVILVIFMGSLTNTTALSVYPADIAFNIISALLITYAIFRYQLLDFDNVVRKGLFYSILTVVIGTGYFLVIYLATMIFQLFSGINIFISIPIIAFLTAIIALPLYEKAQFMIDRFFYREKYDTDRMLQRLNHTMTSFLALDKLTDLILSEVTLTMHIEHAGLFLKQREGNEYYLMAQTGIGIDNLKLSSQHPLVKYLSTSKQGLTWEELEVIPQFRALWQREREELNKIGIDLFLPLKSKDELVGIFIVGPKLSGLTYSQNDVLILTTLANQMAIAIENALLFAVEAKRRQEAVTLQNVLLELTSDLDLEQVMDNILNNLKKVILYDNACVFLLQSDRLVAVACRGFENPKEVIGQNYPIEDDELFQEIQHTRRPLLISDVQSYNQFKWYSGTQNIRSWIGVPLIARGLVIGCLMIDSYTPDAYMEVEQVNLAQAFANHASIAIENARLFKVEREQRQLAEALREINIVLSGTLDFDNLLDLLLDQVRCVVPYSVANIMLVEEGKIRVARTNYLENTNSDKEQLMKTSPFRIFATPNLDHIVKTGQSMVISIVPEDTDWIESPVPIRSWVGAPIIVNGKVTACFSLCKFEPGFYDYKHAELLSIFAGQAALALKNAELFSKIQHLAILDDLTGVFNRRHFFELGEREFIRAQRYDRPLSVVMFDLDHFKGVNDTYGHAVGDEVLPAIIEYCKSNIREVDILGRYGGDEFTIILPEVDSEEAYNLSERIRGYVASLPIKTEAGQIKITISFGIASLSSETKNFTKLINCADSAMYEAKSKGRNCVCVYSEING